MTVVDDDSLADDEGNLRPEVARAVEEGRTDALPPPAHRESIGAPVRPVPPRARPVVNTGGVPTARVTRAGVHSPPGWFWPVVAIAGAILVAVKAIELANGWPTRAIDPGRPGSVAWTASAVESRTRICGSGVRMRTGPGLRSPYFTVLGSGDPIHIVGTVSGWCEVVTGDGRKGWVFGAFVQGPALSWVGPGVAVREIYCRQGGSEMRIRVGEKVLIEGFDGDGTTMLLLPEGWRVRVEQGTVQQLQ